MLLQLGELAGYVGYPRPRPIASLAHNNLPLTYKATSLVLVTGSLANGVDSGVCPAAHNDFLVALKNVAE